MFLAPLVRILGVQGPNRDIPINAVPKTNTNARDEATRVPGSAFALCLKFEMVIAKLAAAHVALECEIVEASGTILRHSPAVRKTGMIIYNSGLTNLRELIGD